MADAPQPLSTHPRAASEGPPAPAVAPMPRFIDAIAPIADLIGDAVAPADFPVTRLRWRNDRAAASIGIAGLSDAEWTGHCARFVPFAGSLPRPLALRYHGHQFRTYNPDLGDGRGFLFAQAVADDGRLLDLGTKGSGQTPYSRFGDGRLTLKGAVRELLATEMLEALGVPTSRTLSIIETGEQLHRDDEPSPTRSAVLVRLSHGHIRIGSFERLATLGLREEMIRLIRWWLAAYGDGGAPPPAEPGAAALMLFDQAVRACADLAAAYMVAGFVHGVLNTDNINLTGESFDYGPWRFAASYDPRFTAAYFDHQGLYAFGRQAEAIHWNLAQLGSALTLADDGIGGALAETLNGFAGHYRTALSTRLLWRLGVAPLNTASDAALVSAVETALVRSQAGIDDFFFDWAGFDPVAGQLRAERLSVGRGSHYPDAIFGPVRAALKAYAPARMLDAPYWRGEAPVSLPIATVEALWAPIAEHDDWAPLMAMVARIRAMGTAMGDPAPSALRPSALAKPASGAYQNRSSTGLGADTDMVAGAPFHGQHKGGTDE